MGKSYLRGGWRRVENSNEDSVMLLGKSGRLSVTRRVVLLIAYVLFIAVNVISQTGAFGLPTNADISDKYSTPITPAGWTFTIWGLIFVLQGGGVLYGLFGPGGEFGTALALGRVSTYWILEWAFSCAWQGFFILQDIIVSVANTILAGKNKADQA